MTAHEICERARQARCACGAIGGQACTCGPGHYHYSRFIRARYARMITSGDLASVIPDMDVFDGMATTSHTGTAPPAEMSVMRQSLHERTKRCKFPWRSACTPVAQCATLGV